MALVFGELFAFARRTLTEALLALGLTDSDWSAFYRLFSRERYNEAVLSECFFKETLAHSEPDEPYVTGIDTTQAPRASLKKPGSGWLRALRTAVFRRGLHRAQRFLTGAWQPTIEEGYTRAIALRFMAAFSEKAVPASVPPLKEWAAGLKFVSWVREAMDRAGGGEQLLLVLADGAYDTIEFWRGLPERRAAVVRMAKNGRQRELPPPYSGHGPRRKYGAVAPAPADWLQQRKGFQKTLVQVRGRTLQMRYRSCGPYLRERAGTRSFFQIVVGGATWKAGKREPRRTKYREPAFNLVSALQRDGQWQLPLPIGQILAWLWERWELEVAHREMKSGLGVGEMQCWHPRAAVASVQWTAWVYAVLLLAGYRSWGFFGGPTRAERWWPGAKRWWLSTLWRSYRAQLWGTSQFRAIWTGTADNWPSKDHWMTALPNAIAGAARI